MSGKISHFAGRKYDTDSAGNYKTGSQNQSFKEIEMKVSAPPISYELIEGNFKHVQGQVLTIVEAVLEDDRQLKAAKDLIKNSFNEVLTRMYQLCLYNGVADTEDIETPNYER